jgi:DNA-binding MarR family transcriptional regulator
MILSHLRQEDVMAQSVLAQALHITPPTATNTLQRMERDGWIERRRDTTDQRIVRVYLTGNTRALSTEVQESFRALDKDLASILTDIKRSNLMAALLKVHRHLSQGSADSDSFCRRNGSPGDDEKENR